MDGVVSSTQDPRHHHARTRSESHFVPDADGFHVEEDVRTFPNQMGSGRRDARVGCETLSSGRNCGSAASPKMRQSASQKGTKSNVRRRNLVYSRNPLLACFVGESVLSSRGMHLSTNCDSAIGSQRTFFSLIPVDGSQVNERTGEPQSPQLSCIGQVKHRHVKTASRTDVVTEDLTRMDINDGVIPHSIPVSRSPPRGHHHKYDVTKLRNGESLWQQKEDSLKHQFESSFKLQRVETFKLRREESFKVQKEQSFKLQKEESYKLLKGLNFKLQAKEAPAVTMPTIDDIPHLDLASGNGLGESGGETLNSSGGSVFSLSSGNAVDVVGGHGLDVAGRNGLDLAGGNGLSLAGGNGLNLAGRTALDGVGGKAFGVPAENASSGAGKNELGVLGGSSLDVLFGNALNVANEKEFFNAHREHIWGVKGGRTSSEDPPNAMATPCMKNAARLTRCSRRVVDDDKKLDDDDKMSFPSHRNSIRYLNHFLKQKLGASMVRSVLVCGWSSGETSPPMSPKSDRSEPHSDHHEIDLSRFAAGEFQPKTPSFRDERYGQHTFLNRKLPDIRIPSRQRPEDRRPWRDETEGKEQNDLCVHPSSLEVGRFSSTSFVLQPVTEAALWKRRCMPRPLMVEPQT